MLKFYYQSLKPEDRQCLIDEIKTETGLRESTVRSWLHERRNPKPLAQKIIAKAIGIPQEKLFRK